ncbi:Hypothetical predicted protein [Paramuricea clavata]|uniref:Uncharacterized protein n=1 Tax=Paramuricea clavata TaxID=317549 RepID=A0A7D9E5T2_PARCT|nr:Hypothetical predicted protein [Paramuricea clavata]
MKDKALKETGNRSQGCGLWISCRSTKFPERYCGDVKGEIREDAYNIELDIFCEALKIPMLCVDYYSVSQI